MSQRLVYPTYQRTKHTGVTTHRNHCTAAGLLPTDLERTTTADLERLYHGIGVETEGPCEVRWAWLYNDLKPRVYYAQGGSAYFAARYIREIANSLCDVFPASARSTRYNLLRLNPIDDHCSFVIYDYASFTSEMTELKHFLRELGNWCMDTTVLVVDTFYGLVERNLGELILEYNERVNVRAEMELNRVYDIPEVEPFIVNHEKSGMLGCYGNIVFSTALHGLYLTFVAGSSERCNVVGDDAAALLKQDEWSIPDFTATIQVIGIVHPEKLEQWLDGNNDGQSRGWKFVKRPVDRISNNLFVGLLFDLPLASYVTPPPKDIHTADMGCFRDRVKAFVMQTSRLLDRMNAYEHRLSEEEIDFALGYLSECYKSLRLPPEGALPPFSHSRMEDPLHLAIPILHRASIARPWLDTLIDESAGRIFSLPRLAYNIEDPEPYVAVSQQFDATSSRHLQLAEDLGYVSKSMPTVVYVVDAASSLLLRQFLRGDVFPLYSYTYIAEPPQWWKSILSLTFV